MTDEQPVPGVRAWLKRTDMPPEDVRRSAATVSALVERHGQRGRWWPLPSLGSSGPTASPEPRPPVASPPTLIARAHPAQSRRTLTMPSPVQAVTAGILAVAIGGAALIAQPAVQEATPLPSAAEVDPSAASIITGTTRWEGVDGVTSVRTTESFWWHDGYTFDSVWETTDSRLNGDVRYVGNWMQSRDGGWQLEAFDLVIENSDGRWVGTGTALAGHGIQSTQTMVLMGDGAYEGLTAYVIVDGSPHEIFKSADGLRAVIVAEMPDHPEAGE